MAALASAIPRCTHPVRYSAQRCSLCNDCMRCRGEELQMCEQCDKPVCSDCMWNVCEACKVNMCDGCNAGCEWCQEDVCRTCKDGTRCDACRDPLCVVCEINADAYTGVVANDGEPVICGLCEKLFAERDFKNKKLCRSIKSYGDLLRRLDVIAGVKDVDVDDPRYFGPLPLPKVAEPGQYTINDYVLTQNTMEFKPPRRLRDSGIHQTP